MARLIILHVADDSAMARQLCGDLPEFRAIPLPPPRNGEPFRVGAGVVLCLMWSPRVGPSGAALSLTRIAEFNPHNTVIVRVDNAALPPGLARLRLPLIEGFLSSQEISIAFRAALERAREAAPEEDAAPLRPEIWTRRQVAPRPKPVESPRGGAFTGGMARGFASSVAVLGLGGSITLGVSDQLHDEGFFIVDANAANVRYDGAAAELSTEALYEPFGAGEIGSFEDLSARADALRELAEVERGLIQARIADVDASLAANRKVTDARIELLEQTAGSRGVRGMAPQLAEAPAKADPAAAETELAEAKPAPAPQGPEAVQLAALEPADEATARFMNADADKPVTKLHDAAALILAKSTPRGASSDPHQI